MRKKRVFRKVILPVLAVLAAIPFLPKVAEIPGVRAFLTPCRDSIVIMSYNVQNLFDDVDDGTEFPAYDPGKGKWNSELYNLKLKAIARAIKSSVPGGPDIIALQEVENRSALGRLNRRYLSGQGYIHEVLIPVRKAAMNVAILSRLPVKKINVHNLPGWEGRPLRNILEAEIVHKGNTIYMFNNHWKSKLGSPRKTEKARLEAAAFVRKRIITLLRNNPVADIIVAGDLNENSSEFAKNKEAYQTALLPAGREVPDYYAQSSLFLGEEPWDCGIAGSRLTLFDPWSSIEVKDRGSYVYRSRWETIDHMLLSPGLFNKQGFYYIPGSFKPVKRSFLLTPRKKYPKGWSSRYKNGYSDHLPVVMTLKWDTVKAQN